MDLRYLYHGEIDYRKWENCIGRSVNLSVYSHTWFLDSLVSDWAGIVDGDYEAVMPVFFSGNRMYLPEFMVWTGIYSPVFLSQEKCRSFIEFAASRFKYAEVAFDRFSDCGKCSKGRFLNRSVYLFDMVKNFTDTISDSSEYVKRLMIKLGSRGFELENITDTVFAENFVRRNSERNFSFSDTLGRIASCAMRKKACVIFALKNKNGVTAGLITAWFAENYIFVPQITVVPEFDKAAGQMILLYHLMSFFEGTPMVLVVDPKALEISPQLLAGMGGVQYGLPLWKIDGLSKIMNFFQIF